MTRVFGPATRCRFGVASRDITPPIGIYHRAWGAANHEVAEGVHRPLYATSAIFAPLDDPNQPTLALVALDFGWFQATEEETYLREQVAAATGVDIDALMINLSHTHAGANATAALADKPGGHLIAGFLDHVAAAIIDTINTAKSTATPAWVSWGYGACALARNRDFWDADRQRWACGYNPGGSQDSTVTVGRAVADNGVTLATFVNYACHPTTLAWENRLLSPDFIGACREVMERAFGAPMLFLQGASGEMAARDNHQGDPAVADRNGRILGYAAASAVEALYPADQAFVYQGIVSSGADLGDWRYAPKTAVEIAGADKLAAAKRVVPLARKPMQTPAEIITELATATENFERERLSRRLLISRALGDKPTFDLPLWTWRLGQATVVAVAGEAYSVFQVDVRAACADTTVLVLGVTNGGVGYLCPAETYGQGRYQEWQSPFQPGCLEQTTGAAIAAARQIMR